MTHSCSDDDILLLVRIINVAHVWSALAYPCTSHVVIEFLSREFRNEPMDWSLRIVARKINLILDFEQRSTYDRHLLCVYVHWIFGASIRAMYRSKQINELTFYCEKIPLYGRNTFDSMHICAAHECIGVPCLTKGRSTYAYNGIEHLVELNFISSVCYVQCSLMNLLQRESKWLHLVLMGDRKRPVQRSIVIQFWCTFLSKPKCSAPFLFHQTNFITLFALLWAASVPFIVAHILARPTEWMEPRMLR